MVNQESIMYRIALILAFVGASMASASDVAFTSYTEMMNSEPTVITDVVVKNTEPTETTVDCIFIREWKGRYPFKNNHKHQYIFYYILQCLDNSMKLLRSNVTFNYDGDDNNMHELPEGCVPPSPQTPPENPCQNGFALGDEIIKNVTTMVTKKLINHPEHNEVPEIFKETINPDQLDEMTKSLPDLEEALNKVIEENHESNPEILVPDETTPNEDGSVTEHFTLPNGDTATRTETDEEVVVVIEKKNPKERVVQTSPKDEPTTVEVFDENDNLVEKKIIEPNPEDPEEEIVRTFIPPDSQTPSEIVRPRRPVGTIVDPVVPDDLEEKFADVAHNFSATLEKYIEESVKCFAEQVINIEDSYLTFVCSTTGHSTIKELLEEKFAGQMLCSKMDCDAIEEELMEQMIDHVNGEGNKPSVTRQITDDKVTISNA